MCTRMSLHRSPTTNRTLYDTTGTTLFAIEKESVISRILGIYLQDTVTDAALLRAIVTGKAITLVRAGITLAGLARGDEELRFLHARGGIGFGRLDSAVHQE